MKRQLISRSTSSDYEAKDNSFMLILLQLSNNMFITFIMAATLAIVSSYLNTKSGQEMMMAASHLTPIHAFALSVLGGFCSCFTGWNLLAGRHKFAGFFVSMTTVFAASAFAALVSVVLPAGLRWTAYAFCMVVVVLQQKPWRKPMQCLAQMMGLILRKLPKSSHKVEGSDDVTGPDDHC